MNDGIIISESLRLLGGFKVGDNVTIDIAGDTYTSEIVGVSQEYTGKAYMKKTTLSEFVTTDNADDYYNVIYSETELSKDDFLLVVSNQDIIDQTQSMATMMNSMTLIITIVSFAMGAIIVYILTVMTIEDNFYNISLFKVIGYNKKEIDKMILGGYFIYGIGIFLFTVPIAYGSFILITSIFAQQYSLVMPFELKMWHVALSLVLYVTIFYSGAFVAKKHLDQISLQEAMKMYQI